MRSGGGTLCRSIGGRSIVGQRFHAPAVLRRISRRVSRSRTFRGLGAAGILFLAGCATLQELMALRDVEFSLDGARNGTLAGVPLQSMREYEDLSVAAATRLTASLARGDLPLRVELLVRASNPAENSAARLLQMSWTFFLDDLETVSGTVDREYALPPGQPVIVPVEVELDLMDYFDGQRDQLVNLALAAAGAGDPTRVRLEAIPSVQTALGPIHYPEPVRIEYEVGG